MGENRQQLMVEIPERHSSPDHSSDDEIILFRGRRSHVRAALSAGISHGTRLPTATSTQSQHPTDATCPLPETSRPTTGKKKKSRLVNGGKGRGPFENEQDVLLDYICNIRENGELEDIYGQHRHIRHDLTESDEDICLVSSQSGDETYGGLYVDDQDDCQHLSKNDTISDLRHTNYYGPNEDNDLSVKQGTLATVAGSTMEPSPAVDPTVWTTVKGKDNLSQEQVDFDVMDRDRPSVQRVKGGKRARAKYITLDDCDSDLERQLQVAWKNDRHRKKERKQQREELRALGMLQKKIASDDLRLKYPNGMTIMQVADELKLFLQQKKETYVPISNHLLSLVLVQIKAKFAIVTSIIFPPMDLHARKTVHELANTFNIKSKSVGRAEQRRPSLYRTIRTLAYSETTFHRAVGQVHRKFLPRADIKGKSRSSSKKQNTSGASMTATNYQEGEIIGATAPELGIGNRGRAMLEKMGWSCGTALGAEDNKGILQPVSLAMKRSKAGLG
ncbi:hypothetical protein E4U21_005083 [Claviceps maximensis]|nr:hypothetical protein E4U21_005083 [Claviceps maximensis]